MSTPWGPPFQEWHQGRPRETQSNRNATRAGGFPLFHCASTLALSNNDEDGIELRLKGMGVDP